MKVLLFSALLFFLTGPSVFADDRSTFAGNSEVGHIFADDRSTFAGDSEVGHMRQWLRDQNISEQVIEALYFPGLSKGMIIFPGTWLYDRARKRLLATTKTSEFATAESDLELFLALQTELRQKFATLPWLIDGSLPSIIKQIEITKTADLLVKIDNLKTPDFATWNAHLQQISDCSRYCKPSEVKTPVSLFTTENQVYFGPEAKVPESLYLKINWIGLQVTKEQARECLEAETGHGWRLPTILELYALRDRIGSDAKDFKYGGFWSSDSFKVEKKNGYTDILVFDWYSNELKPVGDWGLRNPSYGLFLVRTEPSH